MQASFRLGSQAPRTTCVVPLLQTCQSTLQCQPGSHGSWVVLKVWEGRRHAANPGAALQLCGHCGSSSTGVRQHQ